MKIYSFNLKSGVSEHDACQCGCETFNIPKEEPITHHMCKDEIVQCNNCEKIYFVRKKFAEERLKLAKEFCSITGN